MTLATLIRTEPYILRTPIPRLETFPTAVFMGYRGTDSQYALDVRDGQVDEKRILRWGSGLVAGDISEAKRTAAGILVAVPALDVLVNGFPELAAFGFLGIAVAGAAYAAWSLSLAQAQWEKDCSYLQKIRPYS